MSPRVAGRLAGLLALLALAAAALPAEAWAAERPAADPLRSLVGDSPLCRPYPTAGPARGAVGVDAQKSCRATGAIEHPHPLGHTASIGTSTRG